MLAAIAAVGLPGCVGGAPEAAAVHPFVQRLSAASPFDQSCAVPQTAAGSAVEPSLAVDPHDQRHLVAAWQQDRVATGAALGIMVSSSRDGGHTWRAEPAPALTRCVGGPWTLASDSWVSIGPDGSAYASSLTVRYGPAASGVAVSVAKGGAVAWVGPAVVASSDQRQGMLDKEAVLADRRLPGRAYAVWVEYPPGAAEGADQVLFARTSDWGRTWTEPRAIRAAGMEDQFNQLLQLPDGRLVDAFVEAPSLPATAPTSPVTVAARVIVSADGGDTWGQATTAGTYAYTVTRSAGGQPVRSAGEELGAAVGRGADIYLTWFEDGHGNTPSTLSVGASPDAGLTWSVRQVTRSEDVPFLPTVAASGDGVLGVLWYSLRHDPVPGMELPADVWISRSRDRGMTWRTERQDGPFDMASAPRAPVPFVGDYEALVGMPSGFAAVYVLAGSRTGGQPSAAFFARLQ